MQYSSPANPLCSLQGSRSLLHGSKRRAWRSTQAFGYGEATLAGVQLLPGARRPVSERGGLLAHCSAACRRSLGAGPRTGARRQTQRGQRQREPDRSRCTHSMSCSTGRPRVILPGHLGAASPTPKAFSAWVHLGTPQATHWLSFSRSSIVGFGSEGGMAVLVALGPEPAFSSMWSFRSSMSASKSKL